MTYLISIIEQNRRLYLNTVAGQPFWTDERRADRFTTPEDAAAALSMITPPSPAEIISYDDSFLRGL